MDDTNLVDRLNDSPLRRSRLLFIFTILFTPVTVLRPSNSKTVFILGGIYTVAIYVLGLVVLFKLGKQFNRVLKLPGGLVVPERRSGKIIVVALFVIFSIWVNGLFSLVGVWIDPSMFKTATWKPGLGMAIVSLIIAGPAEESWRWSFIITLFYVGSRFLHNTSKLNVLRASVAASAVLFGLGHIGEYPGHGFMTLVFLTLIGVYLFLLAYWSRSFWIAVVSHSLYDFGAGLGMFHLSQWWLSMLILWGILGFFYVKWRKRRVRPIDIQL